MNRIYMLTLQTSHPEGPLFFPHDEFYDDGLRQAIEDVCEIGANGATIAHETQAVVFVNK